MDGLRATMASLLRFHGEPNDASPLRTPALVM